MKTVISWGASFLMVLALGLVGQKSASATLVTVDWAPDSSEDGLAAGTLAGTIPVTLTSTDGPFNGGITQNLSWSVNLGTDGVPGIGDPGVVNEAAAVDWSGNASGFATLTFGVT